MWICKYSEVRGELELLRMLCDSVERPDDRAACRTVPACGIGAMHDKRNYVTMRLGQERTEMYV